MKNTKKHCSADLLKSIIQETLVLATFLTLLLLVTSCDNSSGPVESEHYTQVKNFADSIRAALEAKTGNEVPSINILISSPDEEIFVSSVPQSGTVLTKDTYFRFASNTKTFTSASILNMQEDGWLNINDKITANIPGTSTPYVPTTNAWNIPYKNQITIKQLLQHSAGVFDVTNDALPIWNNLNYQALIESTDPNHQFTVEEMVNQCAKNNLSYFAPGTAYHYSNTGYAILSEIIARVYTAHSSSEKRYSDYLYEYVVGGTSPVKLGIKFPYLATDNQLPAPYVKSRIYIPNNEVITIDQANKSAQVGEGNGYGTMSMLAKWIRTLMLGQNVLNSSTVSLMKSEKSPGITTYALGLNMIKNDKLLGHNGATVGYLSSMFFDVEHDKTIIVMIPMWDFSDNTGANMQYLFNLLQETVLNCSANFND